MDVDVDPDANPNNHTGDSDNDDKDIDYRTCSVSLKAVLRHDLAEHADRIEDLLDNTQNTVAGVVDELQVLMHKAVFAVS